MNELQKILFSPSEVLKLEHNEKAILNIKTQRDCVDSETNGNILLLSKGVQY